MLDHLPDRIVVKASGSIIKNVKSVIVPHTNGLKGIEVAAAAGALYGDADAKLEVLSRATREQIEELPEYVQNTNITVQHIEQGHVFDLEIHVYYEQEHASVRIVDTYTNIVQIEKTGIDTGNHGQQQGKGKQSAHFRPPQQHAAKPVRFGCVLIHSRSPDIM